MLCGAIGLVLGASTLSCSHAANGGESLGDSQQALKFSAEVVIETTAGAPLTSTVLAAREGVTFGPGSVVDRATNGAGPVISSLGKVRAEPEAKLVELFSKGAVDLGNRVHVYGAVHAAQVKQGKGVVIDGALDQSPQLDPTISLRWNVEFPAGNAPYLKVEPRRTSSAAPGRYGEIRVAPRATLSLRSGIYYVSKLQLEPDSVVSLNQDAGPVVIYVADDLQVKGRFTAKQAGEFPDVAVIYLGCDSVHLDAPFRGSLVAPKAEVSLDSSSKDAFEGFFYAKSLKVGSHTTVKFHPGLSLLAASGNKDLEACARAIPVRKDLSGKAQEVAYQQDIARYCSMRGGTSCQIDLTSRVNVDYTGAAYALLTEQLSPAQYLAVVRDRTRKIRAAEDDSTLQQLLCSGSDQDDDLVPDKRDKCPNTPALTPTDADGCTDSTLPQAPDAADVKKALSAMQVVIAPQCSGAAPMPKLPAGGFYYPNQKDLGTFILAGRVGGQPAGCPVFYYFDVETLDTSGAVTGRYLTAFNAIEEVTALLGTSSPVPTGYIQFNAKPGDTGTRGKLGNAGGSYIRYRVAAMNGLGSFGGWSEWKFTDNDDCARLGFKCGG